MTVTLQLEDLACLLQILVQYRGLVSALCPGMLVRCEEPGLSGAGPCQVPVDGRPYITDSQVVVGLG